MSRYKLFYHPNEEVPLTFKVKGVPAKDDSCNGCVGEYNTDMCIRMPLCRSFERLDNLNVVYVWADLPVDVPMSEVGK